MYDDSSYRKCFCGVYLLYFENPYGRRSFNSGLHALQRRRRGQNQAVTISKLDGDVKMIGAVGSDNSGEVCMNSLKRYGIDTTGVMVKEGETTGRKIIYCDEKGESNSVIYPEQPAPLKKRIFKRFMNYWKV